MIQVELNFPNHIAQEKDPTGRQVFFGRHDERRRLEDNFLLRQRRPVMIEGERRIGKTSLMHVGLRSVQARSQGQFVPLFLPSYHVMRSFQHYAFGILYALCQYLGRSPGDTGLLDANGHVRPCSTQELADRLTALVTQEPSRKQIVLCVDELDAILVNCETAPRGREEVEDVVALTDSLIESVAGTPLAFVFNSMMTPDEIKNRYGSPFARKCEVIRLDPMPQSEVSELVEGVLRNQVVFDEGAVDLLLQLSGGSPYFVKLFLNHLIERHRHAEPPLQADRTVVQELLAAAVSDRQCRSVLENIYDFHLKDPEQKLLLLIAARQEQHARQATADETIKRDELALLGGDYLGAARALARRGYLTGAEGGPYGLRLGICGHWLRSWERYEVENDRFGLSAVLSMLSAEVRIYAARGTASVRGEIVDLAPMELQAAICLARAAPNSVTRDQLAEALWPDAQGGVTDNQIDQVIRRLRLALRDTLPWRYVVRVPGGLRMECTILIERE